MSEQVIVTGEPVNKNKANRPQTVKGTLRPGRRHWDSDQARHLDAGETVELTRSQAFAFADKFDIDEDDLKKLSASGVLNTSAVPGSTQDHSDASAKTPDLGLQPPPGAANLTAAERQALEQLEKNNKAAGVESKKK
jgi:hypothetical protein